MNAFRRQNQVPEDKHISIVLDGEALGVKQTVSETDIAEWDVDGPVVLDVHMR